MKNEKKIAPKKYTKKKAGVRKLTEFNFLNIPQKDIARLFSVTPEAVCQWDCPRNANGTYNAVAVVSWYVDRLKSEPSDRDGLETDKLRLQCAKLQIEIDESKKTTVTTQYHREFLAARAADLKDYLMGYAKMNLNEIANQPIEVCQKYWDKIIRNAMNTYVKNRS
jgi:hypothetical protein